MVDTEVPQNDIAIAAFTHSGSGNFAVVSYDADGDRIDLLVNEVGAYEGRRPINLLIGEEVAFMEISANGSWTIELQPIFYATQFVGSSVSGTGADVVVDPDPPSGASRLTITHDGESNVAIWVYSADDRDLLVNEIGDYSGTVLSIPGAILYDIEADGEWTMSR